MSTTRMASRQSASKATVKFDKTMSVGVPFGTVEWERCDHSGNIAEIKAAALVAGYAVVGEPTFKDASVDPEQMHTSTILTYAVEATRN
jgi:hypothetical protein